MIPFKVQQARIAGDTQALKRFGSAGNSVSRLKRILAKYKQQASAKPIDVSKPGYLHQPDLFGYKQGSVAWAKRLMSLSPESIAKLVAAIPATTTRSISKSVLGSGQEGAVWPSFTGQHGFSATKVFYDYYSKFGKKLSDKITNAGFNQALDRAFGGESKLNFHEKAEFMSKHPSIFPKILGKHSRGYTMPLLKPTSELDVRGLIKAKLRRAGFQPERMGDWANDTHYITDIHPGNVMLQRGRPVIADPIVLDLKKLEKKGAVGIPNFNDFSSPSSGLSRGDLVEYVLQHHSTLSRPGRPHLDLRLGKPSTGLYSWAIPKARMPKPNEKLLAPQTQVHAFNYRDFEGKIGKGYGAGSVSMADRGQALVTNISDNSVGFTLAHTKTPVRYRLVRIQNKRNGKSDWLLSGVPVGQGTSSLGSKPKLKLIKDSDLDQAIASATQVQAKIDGAHTIYDIGDKGQTEAYSYRRSVSGAPIVHTERLGLGGVKLPELANTEFRGEAYGTRDGKPLKFQEVSGILNSGLAKAITTQQSNNIQMRNVPFMVTKYKGNPVSEAEQTQVLQQLLAKLPPNFEPAETARTPAQAKQLLQRIVKGKQPQTNEGIVIDGNAKYKIRPEVTGRLRGVMKDKRGLIAGIDDGPDIRLGTGFTRQELSDIVHNINDYVGNPIRIGHQGSFDSGLLRAPSYLGMEV